MFRSSKFRLSNLAVYSLWLLLSSPAAAQGLINTGSNLTRFFQTGVTVLIAAGVLGGLGVIMWGISQMIKKGDQRGDDISWMSIGVKLAGGAFMLSLSWVGTSVLETLGGSGANIGSGF